MEWVEENLVLLRTAYPDLDERFEGGVHWVRIPSYGVPSGIWSVEAVEVAFRIPSQAGEAPYAFWVRPGLTLASGGTINNYAFPASTPWGSDWGQFSFSPAEPWQPKGDIRAGANMLNFARAIADRLREGA
jgi:Prokaryotic E2 family E